MTSLPPWLAALVVAPFIGSFIGVVVTRLPQGRAVVLGRSACPHCGRRLAAWMLVPVLSWIWLRGRCRDCGQPIGWLYPAIELAAVLVPLWAAASMDSAAELWASCVLGWMLLTLAAIDARTFLLPDSLTLPLIPLGLAAAAVIEPVALLDHVIGAVAGFASFALIGWLYRSWRGREGLGGGDAKLLAGLGAWVSWTGLPSLVLIGAVLALATMLALRAAGRPLGLRDRVPFGSFLALAGWLVWLYGPLEVTLGG